MFLALIVNFHFLFRYTRFEMFKKLNIHGIVNSVTGSDSELPGLAVEENDELELVEDSRDS